MKQNHIVIAAMTLLKRLVKQKRKRGREGEDCRVSGVELYAMITLIMQAPVRNLARQAERSELRKILKNTP